MDISNTQKRSMMSFIVIAFFAVGAAVFLIGKGSEAVNEIELLNTGPLTVRRTTLAQVLEGETTSSSIGVANTSNWKTYRNEKYGFEVKYHPTSIIEKRDDLNYQYVRIDKYNPHAVHRELYTLLPGEYSIEIFIYDHRRGHIIDRPCTEQVFYFQKMNLGHGVVGYRGGGMQGGDAGGIRFGLCAQQRGLDINIQGTENDPKAPFINTIFDTFKFIK